jgi:hypothetical protein
MRCIKYVNNTMQRASLGAFGLETKMTQSFHSYALASLSSHDFWALPS